MQIVWFIIVGGGYPSLVPTHMTFSFSFFRLCKRFWDSIIMIKESHIFLTFGCCNLVIWCYDQPIAWAPVSFSSFNILVHLKAQTISRFWPCQLMYSWFQTTWPYVTNQQVDWGSNVSEFFRQVQYSNFGQDTQDPGRFLFIFSLRWVPSTYLQFIIFLPFDSTKNVVK
jgi:hypothetical protein